MKWSPVVWLIYLGLCHAQHFEGVIDEEKCDKLGGPGTYEKLKVANEKSRTCMYELFGISTFNSEAKATGILDIIMPKHESSVEDVSVCLKDYADVAKLCLTKEERISFYTILETISKGVDSVYENDGQGVVESIQNRDCVISRTGAIRKCYSNYSPCKDFDKFKSCTVQVLEDNNCPSTVSVSTAEEFLQFVKSSTCTDNKTIRSRRSLRRMVRDMSGLEQHLPHIKKAVKKKCALNGMSDAELDNTLDKMNDCVEKKPIFITKKEEFIANLDNCTKDARKIFTDCLPEKLKYLPHFLYKLTHSLINLLYDDFFEIADGLGPCVDKLNGRKSNRKYEACINKQEDAAGDDIPTSQATFCKQFLPISACFTKQMNETCDHNEDLDTFMKDYTKAMKEPCET